MEKPNEEIPTGAATRLEIEACRIKIARALNLSSNYVTVKTAEVYLTKQRAKKPFPPDVDSHYRADRLDNVHDDDI